jgi:NitT/TauT family transport system substrate-binding protein
MSTFKRVATALAVTFVAAGALSACGTSGSASSSSRGTVFKIAYTKNANTAALTLGIQQGFFHAHGIDLEGYAPSSTAGSSLVPLLINGQIQASVTDVTAVPSAVSKGIGVQVVASVVADYESSAGDAFSVIVSRDSGITSFKDLEGKTVGVSGLSSFWALEVEEAVRKDGGDPSQVKLLNVDLPDQVAAMQEGRINAVSTLPPFSGQLAAAGFRVLGDPAQTALGPQSIGTTIMASTSYLSAHSNVMQQFLAAWAESVQYANAHPSAVRKVIAQTTGAPAAVVAKLPVPWYVSGVSRTSAEAFMRLMVRYGLLSKPLPVNQVVWAQAPAAASLTTPPPGIGSLG